MRPSVVLLALLCTLSGCALPPVEQAPPGTPGGPAPAHAVKPAISVSGSPGDVFEERHRVRAKAHARDGNLADALIHWELLALLRPNSQEYRDAVADTRQNIARQASHLMQLAELARKQGNLDQAELWYLRVLNVDRDNVAAAQALRDIEADRTKRAYSNRPPRIRMQ